VERPALGPLTWADLATVLGLALFLLLAHSLAVAFLHRKTKMAEASESKDLLWGQFFQVSGGPLYALIWTGGVYMAATTLLRKFLPAQEWGVAHQFLERV
jgi:hypothetical protein